MTKISLSFIVLALLLVSPALSKENFRNKRIAVLEFVANNIDDAYSKAARNRIEVELFKGKLLVLERRSLKKVLFEKSGSEPCRNDACARKQGEMVSADYVVVGDIIFAGRYIITTRVVDVKSGEIIFADSIISNDKENILKKTGTLAKKLAGVVNKKVKTPITNKLDTPFSVGFRCHYTRFDPVWSLSQLENELLSYQSKLNMATKSGFLYNIYFIIGMTGKWSLAASYLYGRHTFNKSTFAFQGTTWGFSFLSNHERKYLAEKHEVEMLFNYHANHWVSVIFGPVYQGYMITMKMNVLWWDTSLGFFRILPPLDMEIKPNLFAMGPAVGVVFKPHLGRGVYLTPSIRTVFLAGKDLIGASVQPALRYALLLDPTNGSKPYYSINVQGSLGVSYIISKAHLAIDAGCNVDFSFYIIKPWSHLKQKYDLSYGPYLGVRYFI